MEHGYLVWVTESQAKRWIMDGGQQDRVRDSEERERERCSVEVSVLTVGPKKRLRGWSACRCFSSSRPGYGAVRLDPDRYK